MRCAGSSAPGRQPVVHRSGLRGKAAGAWPRVTRECGSSGYDIGFDRFGGQIKFALSSVRLAEQGREAESFALGPQGAARAARAPISGDRPEVPRADGRLRHHHGGAARGAQEERRDAGPGLRSSFTGRSGPGGWSFREFEAYAWGAIARATRSRRSRTVWRSPLSAASPELARRGRTQASSARRWELSSSLMDFRSRSANLVRLRDHELPSCRKPDGQRHLAVREFSRGWGQSKKWTFIPAYEHVRAGEHNFGYVSIRLRVTTSTTRTYPSVRKI